MRLIIWHVWMNYGTFLLHKSVNWSMFYKAKLICQRTLALSRPGILHNVCCPRSIGEAHIYKYTPKSPHHSYQIRTMLSDVCKLCVIFLFPTFVASAAKWDLKMSIRDLISGHCHVVTPRVCRKYTGFGSDFTCGFILRHVCTNKYTGRQSLKMLVKYWLIYPHYCFLSDGLLPPRCTTLVDLQGIILYNYNIPAYCLSCPRILVVVGYVCPLL
jgi:hypothetical protein